MKPFIHPSFWSDPEIEQQPSDIKLCALWLITNSQTSVIGICEASPRRFVFETGLKASVLDRVCESLPGTFSRFGQSILIRNFVRHQFGTGDSLTKNNYFKAMVRAYKLVREDSVRHAVLAEYPEFRPAEEGLGKGLPRGSQPLPAPDKGVVDPKEGKGEEGKGEGSAEGRNGETQITVADVKRWAEAYPTLPKPDPEFCEWWWDEQEKRGWTDPQTGNAWHKPKAAFTAAWKGTVHKRQERDARYGTPPPAAPIPPLLEYIKTEWPDWLKSKGHKPVEYQFAAEFLKSDFHKDRKTKQ